MKNSNPKIFQIGYGIVTISKVYFMPNCKDLTGNLWVIHFNYSSGIINFDAKILHKSKKALNYNLSIVRGLIAHELKNVAN